MFPPAVTKSYTFISILVFTQRVFKGMGQIMLQENAVTGLLFLIGICCGSIFMGLGAILATICGTATAMFLKYDKNNLDSGLYGFSAALVGVAVMLFLNPVFGSWILVCFGAMTATMIQHFFIRRKVPVFTLPFVLVTWGVLLFVKYCAPQLLVEESITPHAPVNSLAYAIRGYGQVIFQEGVLAGFLFFIAVYLNSPKSALMGLAAAVLSGLMAHFSSLPITQIELGIWSYNAVLCAIALGGVSAKDGLWIAVAIVVSGIIQLLMVQYNLMVLTFPFVVATSLVLLLKSKTKKERLEINTKC